MAKKSKPYTKTEVGHGMIVANLHPKNMYYSLFVNMAQHGNTNISEAELNKIMEHTAKNHK